MAHPELVIKAKVPILNDQANMTPILNGNLSIHAIRLKLKRDPFPSKLCSHIPSKMDPSRPPPPGRKAHLVPLSDYQTYTASYRFIALPVACLKGTDIKQTALCVLVMGLLL